MYDFEDLTKHGALLAKGGWFERYRGVFLRVLFLALPIISLQLLAVAASFIDTTFLSRFGNLTLAANGLGYRAYYVALIFVTGIVLAMGVRLARVSDEPLALHSTLIQCLYIIFILSICCFLFLYKAAPWLLLLSGQPKGAVAIASPYLQQLAIALVMVFISGFLRQVLMVLGRQVWLYPLAGLYLLSHVIFSYGLILGHFGMPRLGLLGSGVSEWLSLGLTMVMALLLLIPDRHRLLINHSSWRLNSFRINYRLLNFLWRFSWPVAGLFTLEMLAVMLLVIMLGHFGVHAIAAYQMISQLDLLPLMIPYGMGIAIGILVSRQLATSGQLGLVISLVKCAIWTVLVPMVVFSLLFWFYPHMLLHYIFHYQSLAESRVVYLAAHMLMITGLYHLFYAVRAVLTGALRGMGDVYIPMVITVCCFWVFGLGSADLLAKTSLGAIGVWYGMAVAMFTASLAISLRYCLVLRRYYRSSATELLNLNA